MSIVKWGPWTSFEYPLNDLLTYLESRAPIEVRLMNGTVRTYERPRWVRTVGVGPVVREYRQEVSR